MSHLASNKQPFNLRVHLGIQRSREDRLLIEQITWGENHSEMDQRIISLSMVICHLSLFSAYRETIALSNCVGLAIVVLVIAKFVEIPHAQKSLSHKGTEEWNFYMLPYSRSYIPKINRIQAGKISEQCSPGFSKLVRVHALPTGSSCYLAPAMVESQQRPTPSLG